MTFAQKTDPQGAQQPKKLRIANRALYQFNAGGRRGTDGSNGTSYSTSSGAAGSSGGRNGNNGGNAGQPTAGQDAGNADITLKNTDETGVLTGRVIVEAHLTPPGNAPADHQEVTLEIGDEGYIEVDATGGGGGGGGTGGNGQGGAYGTDGSDATQWSSGTSGSGGGNGGGAGAGTSGAGGGRGGKLTFRAGIRDLGLLMLTRPRVVGGEGGDPGNHGTPGSGGRGGRGGSSYHWTETHSRTVSDTDSNGNSTTRTEYYTTSHYNPGGSDGSSGSTGSTPSERLYKGTKGADGKVEYVAVNADGTSTVHDEMYQLMLEDFTFSETDPNRIFEPGERVDVSGLRVRNVGGMQTPPNQPVKIFVASEDWVVSKGIEFLIPRSLQPGEEYLVPQTFEFKIKNTTIDTEGARFQTDDEIRPKAEVTQVNRIFGEFDFNKSFHITFPVEITPINMMKSLAPGETTKVLWEVKNICTKPLGKDSAFKRQVMTALRIKSGDLEHTKITFKNSRGQVIDISNYHDIDLPVVDAGQSILIEGTLQVAADARPYTATTLRNSLRLDLLDGTLLNPIQNYSGTIRVAQTYRTSAKPGLLLVTNSSTTEAELNAWKELLSPTGLSLDVWDLSYYGKIQLTQALNSGSTLEKDFRNKTILLLNNSFNGPNGNARAQEFFARRDFVQAAGNSGVNFLGLGGQNGPNALLEGYLIPATANLGSNQTLWDRIQNYLQSHPERNNSPLSDAVDAIEVRDHYIFGKPKVEAMKRRSEKLFRTLSRLNPEQRNIIAYSYEPELVKKRFLGLIKDWKLGKIEVRRTVSNRLGFGMSIEMADSTVHSPEMILGESNKLAVMLSLTTSLKMELLERILSEEAFAQSIESAGLSDPLIKAILAEIAAQESPFLDSSTPARQMKKGMKLLSGLSELSVAYSRANPTSGKFLNRLAAELHLMANSQMSWYQWITPWSSRRKSSSMIRETAYDLVERYYFIPADRKTALQEITALRQELRQTLKPAGELKSEKSFARYRGPIFNNDLGYGSNLLADATTGVITAEHFEQILKSEQAKTEAIQTFEQQMQAEFCNLKVQ